MKSHKDIQAIFLDRDGVINKDNGYISSWTDFHLINGVIDALSDLSTLKIHIFIITNQSGVARGLFSEDQLLDLHDRMIEFFLGKDINITSVEYCPHHPEGIINKYKKICDCRKPKPGMILKLRDKYNLDLQKSILVGDKESDIQAGISSGIKRCYLIKSKYHSSDYKYLRNNLKEVVDELI